MSFKPSDAVAAGPPRRSFAPRLLPLPRMRRIAERWRPPGFPLPSPMVAFRHKGPLVPAGSTLAMGGGQGIESPWQKSRRGASAYNRVLQQSPSRRLSAV